MRERRLVKLGSSFFISLPMSWVKTNRLGKGSRIKMVEDPFSGGLIITPEGGDKLADRRVVIRREEGVLARRILAAYLNGYREIEIVGPLRETEIKTIDSLTSNLIGVEKIYEGSDRIVYNCFAGDKDDPDLVSSRIVEVLTGMIIDTSRVLARPSKEDLARIASRDKTVNKLYFLLVRLLRSSVLMPKWRLMDYRLLAKNLERMGDELVFLAKRAPETWDPILVETEARRVSEMLRESYRLFLDNDVREAERLGAEAWGESCRLYDKAISGNGFVFEVYYVYSRLLALIKDNTDLIV